MEVVQYILGDLWHFMGFILILAVIFEGIINVITAFRK